MSTILWIKRIGRPKKIEKKWKIVLIPFSCPNDMSEVYNDEPIEDSRLRAVVDYVKVWLSS
jgi:hypothetical protein